jgi:SNF2 family DNA or RNA helicase
VVKDAMQPSVRFSLDECLDLPEQTYETRRVEMSTGQKKAYADMLNKLRAEHDAGEIIAVNEAVKAGKLMQIALGFGYDTNGETVSFDCVDRLKVCKEVIEESSAKVLVFVPYTGALEAVAEELRKDWEVGVVQGSTSKHDRDDVFNNFQKGGSMRVLVANPATLSHGLTLTAADTIIWFGPINSNETYQQACARVRRPGQKKTTVIAHLTATPLEDKAYNRLRNKQAMQGLLLDELKKEAVLNGY